MRRGDQIWDDDDGALGEKKEEKKRKKKFEKAKKKRKKRKKKWNKVNHLSKEISVVRVDEMIPDDDHDHKRSKKEGIYWMHEMKNETMKERKKRKKKGNPR